MEQKNLEEIKAENAKKKEYLRGYRDHVRMVTRIEAELEEIREIKTSISASCDGMPRGSSRQKDLSGYAATYDSLERVLLEERYQRILTYQDISHRIKRLRSRYENDTLFYRYIKGLEFWEIAEKMGFSERQIFRFHGRGLAHLELESEKDVSECQSNL